MNIVLHEYCIAGIILALGVVCAFATLAAVRSGSISLENGDVGGGGG